MWLGLAGAPGQAPVPSSLQWPPLCTARTWLGAPASVLEASHVRRDQAGTALAACMAFPDASAGLCCSRPCGRSGPAQLMGAARRLCRHGHLHVARCQGCHHPGRRLHHGALAPPAGSHPVSQPCSRAVSRTCLHIAAQLAACRVEQRAQPSSPRLAEWIHEGGPDAPAGCAADSTPTCTHQQT